MNRLEWQQILERQNYLEHLDVLVELQRSDCLLLFQPSLKGAERYISGKAFECIASGKPILAMVPPDGVEANLIRETYTGIVVSPEDRQTIRCAILSLFKEWKAGRLAVQPKEEVIQQFERRKLTSQLADILDQITKARQSK